MTETEVERLVVRLTGESSSYVKMIKEATGLTNDLGKTTNEAVGHVDKFDKSLQHAGDTSGHANSKLKSLLHTVNEYKGALLGVIGIGAGMHMVKHSIELAAEAQSSQMSFEVMLGSADKAKKLMTALREYSSETHISMNTLHATTKQLLQNNVDAANIMPISKMVGDITGGDAEKFKHLALAFGQITQTGHLQGDELNQMLSAGFNPLTQMAKDRAAKAGRGGDETFIKQQSAMLSKEMSNGKISADMVAVAMQNATKEGGQFFGMAEKQSKLLSGSMATLHSEVDNVFRTVGELINEGLHLPEVVQSISDTVKEVKALLEGMSTGTKQIIVGAMAAIVVFGMLTAGITIAGVAIGFISAAIGPVGIGLAAVVALTTGWIISVGGVEGAWKKVKEAAVGAWEWTEPVRIALVQLFSTVKDFGVRTWLEFEHFLEKLWDDMVGNIKIDWNGLRDDLVRGIYYFEYALLNMDKTWQVVWTGIKYYAAEAFNFILNNLFIGILAVAFPPILLGMFVDWKELWTKFVEVVEAGGQAIWDGMKKMWDNVKKMFRGESTDFKMDLKLNFKDGEFLPRGVRSAAVDKIVADAKADFEKAKANLNVGFDEFLKQRLEAAGIKSLETLGDTGEKEGLKIGKAFAGATKELHKFDAAAYGSAEALARVMEESRGFKDAQFQKNLPGMVEAVKAKEKADEAAKAMKAAMKEQADAARNAAGAEAGAAKGNGPDPNYFYVDGAGNKIYPFRGGNKGAGPPTLEDDLRNGKVFKSIGKGGGPGADGEVKPAGGDLPPGETKDTVILSRMEDLLKKMLDKPALEIDTANA